MSERRRKLRTRTIAPRRAIAPPARLDRRDDPPVEIFDVVSGPFERHVEGTPRHVHRRR